MNTRTEGAGLFTMTGEAGSSWLVVSDGISIVEGMLTTVDGVEAGVGSECEVFIR